MGRGGLFVCVYVCRDAGWITVGALGVGIEREGCAFDFVCFVCSRDKGEENVVPEVENRVIDWRFLFFSFFLSFFVFSCQDPL